MLRGQVSTGRHAEGGEEQDDQGPPARPVDHSAVVVAGHWGKSRDMMGHPRDMRRASPAAGTFHDLGTLTVTVADVDVVDVRVSFQGEEEANEVGSGEQEGHGVHQGSVGHR